MKLIKLHIDNFGKFHDFNYDFHDDLDCIFQENGWGKTTLAAFIKAMLYGFAQSSSSNLDKNEKKRFAPWNNREPYGGTLEFKNDKDSYRIERTFSTKGKSGDIYDVYNLSTNKKTDEFKDSVGLALFKIDAESFEKSMFVPQKELEFDFSGNLKAKIRDIFEKLDDTQGVENAIKKINAKEPKKKKIQELTKKLTEIQEKIKQEKASLSKIADLQKEKSNLESKQTELLAKQSELNARLPEIEEAGKRKANIAHSQDMLSEIEEHRKKQKAFQDKLSGQDTSVIQINIAKLEDLSRNLNNLTTRKTELSGTISRSSEDEDLKSQFINYPLTDEGLEKVNKNINDYNSLNELQNKQMRRKKQLSTASLITIILGSILLVVGVLIAFVFNKALGVVISVISLIALIIGALLIIFNKKSNHFYIQNDSHKIDLENEIKSFFHQYRLDDMDFSNNLQILKAKSDQYLSLQQKDKENEETLNQIERDITTNKQDQNNIFSLYKLDSRNNINELRELKFKYEQEIKTIKDLEIKYQTFLQENDLNENDQDTNLPEDLSKQLSDIQDSIAKISAKIQENSDSLNNLYQVEETIADDQNKEEELKTELDKANDETKLLKAASNFILKTKELVEKTYVQPINEKVKEYIDELLGKDKMKFEIDSDLRFNGLENERQTDVKFYSKGYRQIFALSLRLALIDCVFQDEKPFLLLDDPFASLDNEKLDQAKQALKEISKKKQVIYLTCHDSRQI